MVTGKTLRENIANSMILREKKRQFSV